MSILNRQRKTKQPCEGCGLHQDLCLCDQMPSLKLRTKLLLVIHKRELKRSSNTGSLALRALVNSALEVRGEGREALDLSPHLDPDYRSLLFYPAEGATELTSEFVALDPRPIQLIVPDGNWRQASKVHYRQKELQELPRVTLKADPATTQFLRKESKPEGMATLEAIAKAYVILEGPAAGDALMALYQLKLERTLRARAGLAIRAQNGI